MTHADFFPLRDKIQLSSNDIAVSSNSAIAFSLKHISHHHLDSSTPIDIMLFIRLDSNDPRKHCSIKTSQPCKTAVDENKHRPTHFNRCCSNWRGENTELVDSEIHSKSTP